MSSATTSGKVAGRASILPAAVLLLIAATVRLLNLGTRDVWLDEAASFHIVAAGEVVEQLTIAHTPPLYYVSLWLWSQIAGLGATALRFPSAIAGVAFVVAAFWSARKVSGGDREVGLFAALFAALSPIHVYYSQEARAYSFAVLFLVLAYGCVWRATEQDRRRGWAWFSVASAAAMLSHYLSLFALAPTAVLLLANPSRWRGYLAGVFGAVVLVTPWLVWSFLVHSHPNTGTQWIAEIFAATPPLLAVPKSFEVLTIGPHEGFVPIRLKAFSETVSPLLRIAGVGACLVLSFAANLRTGTGRRAAGGFLIACFIGSLGSLWLMSWIRPIYVVGRYDLVALPALVLVLGLGLGALREWIPRLALGVLVAYLVPVSVQLWNYHSTAGGGGNRAVAAALMRGVSNGDVVVATNLLGLPLFYELRKMGIVRTGVVCRDDRISFACLMYPRATERTPASLDAALVDRSPRAIAAEVDDVLAARRSPTARIHVLFGKHASKSDVLAIDAMDNLLVKGMQRRGLVVGEAHPRLGLLTFDPREAGAF